MKRISLAVVVFLFVLSTCLAQDWSKAKEVAAYAQAITTPDGISEHRTVAIGGIQQAITIRGNHKSNPVLLFIHGGPGYPIMPVSYTFQRPWEEYFTVVQWDQRAAGKTFGLNNPDKVLPTLTTARFVDDAIELIRYLRTEFHQDKIFVLGHSWGSIIGLQIAQKHPEWLHAYIGVGQAIDVRKNEQLGYDALLAHARSIGNHEAIRELESLAPFVSPTGPLSWEKTQTERKWMSEFGGYTWNRPNDHYFDLIQLSPDYTDKDFVSFQQGLDKSVQKLWPELTEVDFSKTASFRCPVILFHGRHDLTTSHTLVEQWFPQIKAPSKKLVWFPNSAHMVMMEEPGRFFYHLVRDVRPLAPESLSD
ncbi:MAG TPA: alpha/beta hydrolase [Terriglobales bacterium]|nr:alpha/beta hydrolase [Terriglobales bacterium]